MAEKKRNIVFIMCDQLRADFLNCYGADFIPTPNLDELARNGVVFDNAITASTVCAPARAAMITGRHVSSHGAWTNNIPCNPGVEKLPERMNRAGYMTAAFGCYDHAPRSASYGYRYRRLLDGSRPGSEYLAWLQERHPEETNAYATDNGLQFKYTEDEFYDHWSTTKAIEFINEYTQTGAWPAGGRVDETLPPLEADSPFYMYLGFNSPHGPHLPPKERRGSVDFDKIPKVRCIYRDDVAMVQKNRRAFLNPHEELANPGSTMDKLMDKRLSYCEMIVEVDRQVGRLVDALKKAGVYENTTIIFSSDHGSTEDDFGLVDKGPWPYKCQLFIPMIIANDPRLTPGTHCDALCGNLDIGGTALDIAGDHEWFGTSRSMIGLAEGSVPEREVNMSEFCDASKTLVDKKYTFMYYPFAGETFLFDREADPQEQTNLAGRPESADIERRFFGHLVDFLLIAKGVRVEAHDMVHPLREGIEKKDPKFLDHFDIAYPLNSMEQVERLRLAGLPDDINDFCKTRPIFAHYGVFFGAENIVGPKRKDEDMG